jgi:hypothetical protein
MSSGIAANRAGTGPISSKQAKAWEMQAEQAIAACTQAGHRKAKSK